MIRICSLLPSATEIVYALGLGDQLVAVTHECDYPPEAAGKPHVTSSVIHSEQLTSAEIDRAVRESLADQETIYHLDGVSLERLQPDLILTQELCEVCAVGKNEVREVVRTLSAAPQVVSLEPHRVGDVLETIVTVGHLVRAEARAHDLVSSLARQLEAVRAAVSGQRPVSVLTLEWLDPPFVGGHWVPEMVEMAGGRDVLGQIGQPSRQVDWREILQAEPEVIVAMPCGFGLDRSIRELRSTRLPAEWNELEAVRRGNVYVVDGSSYFNRPGPRIVDGVEILATILHSRAFARSPHGSWARYVEVQPVEAARNAIPIRNNAASPK